MWSYLRPLLVRPSALRSLQCPSVIRNPILPGPSISGLRFRSNRSLGKKKIAPTKDAWSVIGYATAVRYNMLSLEDHLEKQGIYERIYLEEEIDGTCMCFRSIYNVPYSSKGQDSKSDDREIFFFADGSVIFWNVSQLERDTVLRFLKIPKNDIEEEPYDEDTILEESEMMNFTMGNSSTSLDPVRGVISLAKSQASETNLEKYAFSNAIAASVKLGVLESTLDRLIDSIKFVTDDLKSSGKIHMTQSEVLQKTGEIFALRHTVNLSSDLLDTPDFYWDREKLEHLYHITCAHLTIGKRTRVMNEKLMQCVDLMDLLRSNLSDKHHVRLEWFIIVLIMVEVIFELLHFAERFI